MTNHYHLFVQTAHGNLSAGMRQLNGVFTQWSNRRHRRSGHLFQGRYKGILVDSDAYFQEVCRYVVLNPVRAGMMADPADWPWSSYRATAGAEPPSSWLSVDAVLAAFGGTRGEARESYQRFVLSTLGSGDIWAGLNRQVFLGDDRFVEGDAAQARLGAGGRADSEGSAPRTTSDVGPDSRGKGQVPHFPSRQVEVGWAAEAGDGAKTPMARPLRIEFAGALCRGSI
jgi:hypothetical protein